MCLQEGQHRSPCIYNILLPRPFLTVPQPPTSLPFDLHEGALDCGQRVHMSICVLGASCTPRSYHSCPRNSRNVTWPIRGEAISMNRTKEVLSFLQYSNCIGYFSCRYNLKNDKNSLMNQKLFWVMVQGYSPLRSGKSQQQELGAAGPAAATVKNRREMDACA